TQVDETLERSRVRFDGYDASGVPDEAREEQRLAPDACADVEDDVAGPRHVLVEHEVACGGGEDPRRRGATHGRVRDLGVAVVVDPRPVAPVDEARSPVREADPDRRGQREQRTAPAPRPVENTERLASDS